MGCFCFVIGIFNDVKLLFFIVVRFIELIFNVVLKDIVLLMKLWSVFFFEDFKVVLFLLVIVDVVVVVVVVIVFVVVVIGIVIGLV